MYLQANDRTATPKEREAAFDKWYQVGAVYRGHARLCSLLLARQAVVAGALTHRRLPACRMSCRRCWPSLCTWTEGTMPRLTIDMTLEHHLQQVNHSAHALARRHPFVGHHRGQELLHELQSEMTSCSNIKLGADRYK